MEPISRQNVFTHIMKKPPLATLFAEKTGRPDLLNILTQKLSASEFNTLMLEVFRQRAERLKPAEVLRQYRQNRFVQASAIEPIRFGEFELYLLREAARAGFAPVELSPLSPFGACSVVGPTSQNKIVSAMRGTEVTADATNVLALESVLRRQATQFPVEPLRLCTAHRHVRAQALEQPGHTAHFKVFCMTTAGRDTGSFAFERRSLLEHWAFYRTYLQEKLGFGVFFRIKSLAATPQERRFVQSIAEELTALNWPFDLTVHVPESQPYYRILQTKLVIRAGEQELEIADSGFTDWTQRLSGNRKERFLISGMGTGLLYAWGAL